MSCCHCCYSFMCRLSIMHKGAEKAHNIPGHINYYMLATVARRTGVPVPVLANILYCREHQSINHTAWWTIATSTDYHVLLLLLYISIIILVIASTQSLICSSQYADSYIPSFSPTGTSDVCGVDGGGRWVARHSRARRPPRVAAARSSARRRSSTARARCPPRRAQTRRRRAAPARAYQLRVRRRARLSTRGRPRRRR